MGNAQMKYLIREQLKKREMLMISIVDDKFVNQYPSL